MLKAMSLILGLIVLISAPAESETFYVAPLGTQLAAKSDGTEALPFLTIQEAFASGKVKGGDTLLLKDGAYGGVTIKANAVFDVPVTIASQNGKSAHFDNILLAERTRNLTLRNLSVWPRSLEKGVPFMVRAYETTSDIVLDGLDIRSDEGAEAYMQWGAAEWEARKFSGVMLQGPRSLVIRSKLTGVYHGIMVANDSMILNNTVDGFNGDGMRAFSHSIVRENRVVNCVKTDSNHDDGFQSFSVGGVPVTGLVLESNTIIEWMGAPDHALRGTLEGIGLFDGFYDDLTIVNNLVSVSHYHGISVYGARGARILNNTVVNILGILGTNPYIAVRPHKDGTLPIDTLVASNVAMSIQGTASVDTNVIFRNNSVIGAPIQVFENPGSVAQIREGFIL
jgi:parallel beta-helix repeat protein